MYLPYLIYGIFNTSVSLITSDQIGLKRIFSMWDSSQETLLSGSINDFMPRDASLPGR